MKSVKELTDFCSTWQLLMVTSFLYFDNGIKKIHIYTWYFFLASYVIFMRWTFLECLNSDRPRFGLHLISWNVYLQPRQSRFRKMIPIGCRARLRPDVTYSFVGISGNFGKCHQRVSFLPLYHMHFSLAPGVKPQPWPNVWPHRERPLHRLG